MQESCIVDSFFFCFSFETITYSWNISFVFINCTCRFAYMDFIKGSIESKKKLKASIIKFFNNKWMIKFENKELQTWQLFFHTELAVLLDSSVLKSLLVVTKKIFKWNQCKAVIVVKIDELCKENLSPIPIIFLSSINCSSLLIIISNVTISK